MFLPAFGRRFRAGLLAAAAGAVVVACGSVAASPVPLIGASGPGPSASQGIQPPSGSAAPIGPSPLASPVDTAPPDSGGTTAAGDIPDNAVFLTYRGTNPGFSIQYVEGWQVTPRPDGVAIRDKDSSETVAVVARTDVATYVASTDLPALQAQAGFKLVKQETVKVGSSSYVHLVFHLPAPPDPVTGKQVPSTVDRYYVPGSTGLAIVSLSTPDGVDNVDAFHQMIGSFSWS